MVLMVMHRKVVDDGLRVLGELVLAGNCWLMGAIRSGSQSVQLRIRMMARGMTIVPRSEHAGCVS